MRRAHVRFGILIAVSVREDRKVTRFLIALAAMTALSSGAAAKPPGTCSSRISEEFYAKIHAQDERHLAEAEKLYGPIERQLLADNAEKTAMLRRVAKDYAKAHPAEGPITVYIGEPSAVVWNYETSIYAVQFSSTVEYRYKTLPIRIARFDENGNFVEDKLTPYGLVMQTADAFAAGIGAENCRWVSGQDLNGRDYISEVFLLKATGENTSVVVGHLWFNADGISYRGEKYVRGKTEKLERAGAYQDERAYPQQLPVAGELARVEKPRLVTYACDACRAAADRRNDEATRLIALADEVNKSADEYNVRRAAFLKSIAELQAKGTDDARTTAERSYFTAGTALKARYDVVRAQYDTARAAFDASDRAFTECEKQCRKPVAADGGPSAGIGIGLQASYLPDLSFLGRETPGDLALTLGLFAADDTLESEVYEARIGIRLSDPRADDAGADSYPFGPINLVEMDVRIAEADGSTGADTLPLDGDTLVIPGLGVGPNGNGYALGYFGGLNTLEDAFTRRRHDLVEFGADFHGPSAAEIYAESMGFRVEVGAYEDDATFGASIPGFARDVGYEQSIDSTAYKFGVFADFAVPLDEMLTLGLEMSASLVWTDFEGSNTLRFTGFADQVVEDEGGGLGGEFNMTAYLDAQVDQSFSIILTAGWIRGEKTTPIWETPGGGELAEITLESAEYLYFGAGLNFHF